MISNGMNPLQLIGMIRKSGNPQQFLINMLEQQGGNNPVFANLITLAKNNDTQSIEQVARNILKERGLDFDKEFADFRNQFGL